MASSDRSAKIDLWTDPGDDRKKIIITGESTFNQKTTLIINNTVRLSGINGNQYARVAPLNKRAGEKGHGQSRTALVCIISTKI